MHTSIFSLYRDHQQEQKLRKLIVERKLSKEKLQAIHDEINRVYQNQKKTLTGVFITVFAIMLICCIAGFVNGQLETEVGIFGILVTTLILGVIYALFMLVSIPSPKRKFIKWVKQGYPEYAVLMGEDSFRPVSKKAQQQGNRNAEENAESSASQNPDSRDPWS